MGYKKSGEFFKKGKIRGNYTWKTQKFHKDLVEKQQNISEKKSVSGTSPIGLCFFGCTFWPKNIKGGLEDGNRIKWVYIYFNLLICVLWMYPESMVSSNPYMYM